MEHVHSTQNERWQDESTQRPVCADRTLDDLLFIQIKIFPSIKLLQRNLSDVSLSGVRCASFMRQYPFFAFDWHIFYSYDLFLLKLRLYITLRQTDASVATVWCQQAFLWQRDWHDFAGKRLLLLVPCTTWKPKRGNYDCDNEPWMKATQHRSSQITCFIIVFKPWWFCICKMCLIESDF